MLFPSFANFGYFDITKKDKIIDSYIRYYLDRLQSMFKYTNLPETIPAKYLELYLMINGDVGIIEKSGSLYAVWGSFGDIPNEYYIPTKYIVANPYLKVEKSYIIDKDISVIYNDTMDEGLMPLLQRYAHLMAENVISMRIETINSRMSTILAASDDKTYNSAKIYLKQIEDGKLGVISENQFLDGINVQSARANSASNITNLIEMQQYLKASLYNELGLNANYNMKREAINSNESQLNDDMLTPLIDNMLKERQEGLDRVNAMFGTDISVDFDSAWEDNEKEHDLAIDTMEAQTEAMTEAEDETPAEAEDTSEKKDGEDNA